MSPGAQILQEEGIEIGGSYEGDRLTEQTYTFPPKESLPGEAGSGFDAVLQLAGNSGRWQHQLFCLVGLGNMFIALHSIGAVFLSATPEHWCDVGWAQSSNKVNSITFRNISIPRDDNGFSSCLYYKRNSTFTNNKNIESTISPYNSKDGECTLITEENTVESEDKTSTDEGRMEDNMINSKKVGSLSYSNETERCNKWHFDNSTFYSTIVTEYSLVCSRRWLASSVQVCYMLGVLVGSLVMGGISDRFGRRWTSLFCTVCMVIFGCACAFVSAFWGLLVLRFLLALSGSGVMIVNYVLLLELLSPSLRTAYGMLYGFWFGIGFVLLAAFSYGIRNWRHLQLTMSCCSAIMLANFKLLPESPRWLLSQGNQIEALRILREIATVNGRNLPNENELSKYIGETTEVPSQSSKSLSGRCMDLLGAQLTLVRTPRMRRRCLVCFFMWFVVAMIYYGITFSGGNINADLFLMTVAGGLMEMLACSSVVVILNRFGRRKTSCSFFVVSGISCLLVLAVPRDYVYTNFTLMNVGKYFVSGVFMVAYIYSAEVVPTTVRNVAVGTSSMCARVGSSMAPFIVDLLGGVHWALPSTVFGVLALIAAVLTLLLPETQNTSLPETVADVEAADK